MPNTSKRFFKTGEKGEKKKRKKRKTCAIPNVLSVRTVFLWGDARLRITRNTRAPTARYDEIRAVFAKIDLQIFHPVPLTDFLSSICRKKIIINTSLFSLVFVVSKHRSPFFLSLFLSFFLYSFEDKIRMYTRRI